MTAGEPDILVTGATGFVGTAVLRELVGRGMGPRVRILVRRPVPPWMTDAGVTGWPGDLTDPQGLAGLCTGITTLVHLASQVGGDAEHCTAVNEMGTANLLAEASRAGTASVLYLSTCAVYRDGVHRGAAVPVSRSGLGAGSASPAGSLVASLPSGAGPVAEQGPPTSAEEARGSKPVADQGPPTGGGHRGAEVAADLGPPATRPGPPDGAEPSPPTGDPPDGAELRPPTGHPPADLELDPASPTSRIRPPGERLPAEPRPPTGDSPAECELDPASPTGRTRPRGEGSCAEPTLPAGRPPAECGLDPAAPTSRTRPPGEHLPAEPRPPAGHPPAECELDPAAPTSRTRPPGEPLPAGPTPPTGHPLADLELDPASPTSRSKLAAEYLVLAAGGTVLRPHLVHGPGDRHVVPALARWIQAVPAWAEGGEARTSLVAVADLAAAIAVLALDPGLTRPGEILHVTDPQPVTIRNLVTEVCALLDLPLPTADLPLDEHRARTRKALPSLTDHQYSLLTRDHWYESSRIWHLTGVVPSPSPRLTDAAGWYRESITASAGRA